MMIFFCLREVSRSRQFKQGWRQTRPGDQETRRPEQSRARRGGMHCVRCCNTELWRKKVLNQQCEEGWWALGDQNHNVQKVKIYVQRNRMCERQYCAKKQSGGFRERDTSRDWEWYAAPTAADSTKARASLPCSKYQNMCFQEILRLQDFRYPNFEHNALV